MKYIHKQSGQVAVDVVFSKKFGTYTLKLEDGTERPISGSTFKRWWKAVEDDTTPDKPKKEEKKVKKEEKLVPMPGAEKLAELKKEVDEDTCADGRKYSDIGKEIAEQAKEKAKRAKADKPKKERVKVNVDELYDKVNAVLTKAGYETRRYEAQPKTIPVAKKGEKSFCNVYLGRGKCVLCMRTAEVPDGYKADRTRNCPFGSAFDISYDELNKLAEILKGRKIVKKSKEEK